jgi:uncharacterized LabA/DUF88 family protein
LGARANDTYLFIDGEYLRRIFNQSMQSVFSCDGELDFKELKNAAGARRAYFYDCLDDIQRPGESDGDYARRVETQETFFAGVQALSGFHVRLGSLRGSPKRLRQKEVDVLLAVDMLTHGFDGNVEKAVLLAGDLDFRPIIEALVRRGVFVEVWYEKNSLAKELRWAADHGYRMDFEQLYRWAAYSFRERCPLPRVDRAHLPLVNVTYDREGSFNGRNLRIMQDCGRGDFVLRFDNFDGILWMDHSDRNVLERYFTVTHGPIVWA